MTHEPITIGCVLLDNSLLDKALEAGIGPAHFTTSERATLWRTFVEMRAKGKAIDTISVALYMGQGVPMQALMECENSAPTSLHFQDALDATVWEHKKRLIHQATLELSHALQSGEPGVVLEKVAELQDVATAQQDKSAADVEAAATEVEQAFQDALDGKKDTRPTYPMPLPEFDRILGPVHDNELIVVAARPSVGKTSFCLQMLTENVRAGYNVALVPTEMEAKDVIRQLAAQAAKVDLQNLSRELPENLRRAKEVATRIRESKQLRIFDKSTDLSVIWACCRQVKGWADIVVIDQLAQIRNPQGKRYESLTDTCYAMVAIKKMLGKPVVLAHQLSRPEKGTNPPPSLADLKDTGAVEEVASRVLLLHYPTDDFMGVPQIGIDRDPPMYRDMYILQGKHRFGTRDVSVRARYHAPTTRFIPVS
jgi:replicative DNA helicase